MTELKTLKDLNLFNDDLKDNIAKDKLKAEAIKWFKIGSIVPIDDNPKASMTWEAWLSFFNITEEDLQ